MSFDAAEFLQGLFGAVAVSAADPGDTESTGSTPAASRFAGWVRRQDVTGKWGWEPPDLTEADRWWARFRFEDLPELPAD